MVQNTYVVDKNNEENILNYRVVFGGQDIDYNTEFHKCRKYFSIIDEIMTMAEDYGVKDIWFFFEPEVEITWIEPYTTGRLFIKEVIEFLNDRNIHYKVYTPEDNGFFAEWFGSTQEELKLGYKRYALLSKVSTLLLRNQDVIEDGAGWERHFIRCCHTLANQLGLNYKDEGLAMLKRALFNIVAFYGDYSKAHKMYGELMEGKDPVFKKKDDDEK